MPLMFHEMLTEYVKPMPTSSHHGAMGNTAKNVSTNAKCASPHSTGTASHFE